ncbi:TPA: tRNA pseudouridine(54/55) synthase Pus10, partial [Candidatus Micrarchaeota archaeon]|nr:tRNA pseudouridine(54/55) synthase Pus10 [Candidatus Micrarchaeota archaeon]
CDHCLGRAFLEVEGKDNRERGRKVREAVGAEETPPEDCYFCMGVFSRIDRYVEKAEKEMRGYVFRTFRVGTHVPKEMIAREETLWETVGVKNTETIKKHINREVGKRIRQRTGKEYDAENPDVDVIIDVEADEVRVRSNPIYLYGRYRKYAEMPQSKWPCRYCGGRGCERCEFTGRQWKETVEYYIADVLLGVTGGADTKLHAAGREDIDARMLGTGRPFVIEVVEPRIRFDDWEWVRREINAHGKGKVEVLCLLPSDRREARELKTSAFSKTYRAFVECERPVTEEALQRLRELEGATVYQRTPERIKHRRPDALRKRRVLRISWEHVDERRFVLYITGESGLYIKELVSGDGGRTRPSVSEILGIPCKVTRLDVMEIHGGRTCST